MRRGWRAMAGPTVKLLGRVSDETLADLLNSCRAFIFPGWKILASRPSTPWRAASRSSPLRAVVLWQQLEDGVTGILFDETNTASLAAAIQKFSDVTFAPEEIRSHAEQFSVSRFKRELIEIVSGALQSQKLAQ